MSTESWVDREEKIADAVKLARDAAYYSQDPAGTIKNYLEGLRDDPDWRPDEVRLAEDQILICTTHRLPDTCKIWFSPGHAFD